MIFTNHLKIFLSRRFTMRIILIFPNIKKSFQYYYKNCNT